MYSIDLKKAAINCYIKLKSFRKVADILKVSKSTINRWFCDYKKNKNNINKNNKNKNKRIKPVLTKKILSFIKNSIYQKPTSTIFELKQKIYNKFHVKISTSSVSRGIKMNNFSLKKIKYKPYLKNKKKIEENKSKKKYLKSIIKKYSYDDIISVDEFCINRNSHKNYGRSIKGKKLFIKERPISKRYSVICAISNSDLLAYEIHQSNINGEIFMNFIQNKILKYHKNKFILMDNVSFHTNPILLKKIREDNLPLFIPAYSPELNPIEEVFAEVKYHFLKFRSILKNKNIKNVNDTTIKNIVRALNSLDKNNLMKYYKHSFD
jgi:transposase